MKRTVLILAMTVAIAAVSQAQRLIPGQRGLQLSIGVPVTEDKLFDNGNFVANMAMTVSHKRTNHWFFGLEYAKKHFAYRDTFIPSETVAFEVGYMLNLFSDAGKNVLLNTGITAVAGYETVNRNEKILPDGATLLDKDRFVYGGAYHLSLDIYAADNFVVFVKGKCNILWGSDVEMFRPALQTGIRIIF
ncbi:conjugal transfer protein TraO [Petrimonas sp.]|uniref:conjugal transfer protein TraO n=1 Tax=Petrimonas sp. TaxID=2023866 RepID=UPI003F516D2B